MSHITDESPRPSVSIHAAMEGVCFLCGTQGPIFEASTECGRLIRVPLCSKDLFIIVTAQHRSSPRRDRARPRSRSSRPAKTRGMTIDALPLVGDHPPSDHPSSNGTST